MTISTRGEVRFILGPTNTGKTFYALSRMLGYETGMAGFPLRLLARENYDRLVSELGREKVALVTGEEKIIPEGACYYLCTVESLPLQRETEYLVIDEIQLCSDERRGHIYSDLLFHARGSKETLFIGSQSILSVVRRLFSGVRIERRVRTSSLEYRGYRGIKDLGRGSAIVTFSGGEIFRLAGRLREMRRGASVVMGSLAPAARRHQVDLFESGEVDYLVATDAIGLGLNLAIEHVAFAHDIKFDGTKYRNLHLHELSQLAGRAGRGMRSGSFGTTEGCRGLGAAYYRAIEEGYLEDIEKIYWRNRNLDFTSLGSLIDSLSELGEDALGKEITDSILIERPSGTSDSYFLHKLSADSLIRESLVSSRELRILWEVCSIPNFQTRLDTRRINLLRKLYFLLRDKSYIPSSWIESRVREMGEVGGEIVVLLSRIRGIRTLNYLVHKEGWVEGSTLWRERLGELESVISLELSQELERKYGRQREGFIVSGGGKGHKGMSRIRLLGSGEISYEGAIIGQVRGLRIQLHYKELAIIVNRLELYREVERVFQGEEDIWLGRILADANKLHIVRGGIIKCGEDVIGELRKGGRILRPQAHLARHNLGKKSSIRSLERFIENWLRGEIESNFASLYRYKGSSIDKSGEALGYILEEGLGSCHEREYLRLWSNLDKKTKIEWRKRNKESGLVWRLSHVYFPSPPQRHNIYLRCILLSIWYGENLEYWEVSYPLVLLGRGLSISSERALQLGYIIYNKGGRKFAVRIDKMHRWRRLHNKVRRVRRVGVGIEKDRTGSEYRNLWRGSSEGAIREWFKVHNYKRDSKGLYSLRVEREREGGKARQAARLDT